MIFGSPVEGGDRTMIRRAGRATLNLLRKLPNETGKHAYGVLPVPDRLAIGDALSRLSDLRHPAG